MEKVFKIESIPGSLMHLSGGKGGKQSEVPQTLFCMGVKEASIIGVNGMREVQMLISLSNLVAFIKAFFQPLFEKMPDSKLALESLLRYRYDYMTSPIYIGKESDSMPKYYLLEDLKPMGELSQGRILTYAPKFEGSVLDMVSDMNGDMIFSYQNSGYDKESANTRFILVSRVELIKGNGIVRAEVVWEMTIMQAAAIIRRFVSGIWLEDEKSHYLYDLLENRRSVMISPEAMFEKSSLYLPHYS